MNIYWMTDLHMKDSVTGLPEAEGAIRRERHYYAAKDKLRHAVDIINRERPDFVVCTGDITDDKQPFATFLEEWNKIEVPKEIIIGNHDLPNGYEFVVNQLGYDNRPTVAGSKFNRSLLLHQGDVKARIILLDTYIGEDGGHRTDTTEATIQEDAFDWLESEFMNGSERTSLVFSHNGIGGPVKWFDQRHVQRFMNLADQAIRARKGLRIYNLAGHHHVHPTAVVKELIPNFAYINGVAMIAEAVSYLNVVRIKADGSIELDYREVKYPFPSIQE